MSFVSKPTGDPYHTPIRRLWKVPVSKTWWIWLAFSTLFYGLLYFWFIRRMHAVPPDQAVGTGPMSIFGWIALALMLWAATYTLRRRYMRGLPGQAQDWLWMHLTIGTIAALVTMLHSNYDHLLFDINLSISGLLSSYAGPLAAYGLYILVACGLIGRLLDRLCTRMITREASVNGAGIIEAVEQRIEELDASIERLAAGKSADFYLYCQSAIGKVQTLSQQMPVLGSSEREDFQQVTELLQQRSKLKDSLRRQHLARTIMSRWRVIHIVLAILAALFVALHLGIVIGPRLLRISHILSMKRG